MADVKSHAVRHPISAVFVEPSEGERISLLEGMILPARPVGGRLQLSFQARLRHRVGQHG